MKIRNSTTPFLIGLKIFNHFAIVRLNNDCMCCTIRGGLLRMFLELVKTKIDKFDLTVLETTCIANLALII